MGDVAEIATVAWGYTMADIDRIAKSVARYSGNVSWLGDRGFGERVDAAWFGIAERLYDIDAYPDEPAERDLFIAGRIAVNQQEQQDRQAHGINKSDDFKERKSFGTYWRTVAAPTEDFTDRIAERLALPQALKLLELEEYEAIAALAAFGTYRAASEALGIGENLLWKRISSARRTIIAAWIAPETPPEKPKPGTTCRAGHPRAEHGFQEKISADGRTAWRCRICRRKSIRRADAAHRERKRTREFKTFDEPRA